MTFLTRLKESVGQATQITGQSGGILTPEEYTATDGTGLAALIASGQVSADEVLVAAREVLARANPAINAVVLEMEPVRESGRDQPFAGVPFLLKDLLGHLQGTRMTAGSRVWQDRISGFTSEIVRRFLRSGVVIIGKTNTPELGITGVTEPLLFGPARNPRATGYTPGGSSGGSAAAVAAGIVPMASAGDGGGSIRIPASCCGLFGLKPTRGRTPLGPAVGESWDGAVVQHVLSRSVRDSAIMLDALGGADPGSPYTIAGPSAPWAEQADGSLPPLRIGYQTNHPLGLPVAGPCRQAVAATAALLEEMGHRVEEAPPPVDGDALARAYLTMLSGQVAADVAEARHSPDAGPVNRFEPATRILAELGRSLSAGEYALSKREWHRFGRSMATWHEDYDLLLTPTLAGLPPAVGGLRSGVLEDRVMELASRLRLGALVRALGLPDAIARRSLAVFPFTQLANITGQPAMSVPLHREGSLPVGVQFVAPWGREDRLYALAFRLEQSALWQSAPSPFPHRA